MIVGHPGEGETEFNELLDFAREARFERLGAFMYSEEEGTYGAENFEDDVPSDVKQERLDELMTLQSEISLAYNQSRVGSVLKVIIDDYSSGVFVCRSEYDSPEVDGEILVKYEAAKMDNVDPYSMIGEFIEVKVVGADEYDLIAEFEDFI
jgi:ribosomal protein S12 methylthiotransferase